jgi:hypothetical protein
LHRVERHRGKKKGLTSGERFAYRLSLALGFPRLDWLDELTASELAGWQRYYDAEPWGGERDDMRAEVFRVRHLHGDNERLTWQYPYVVEEVPLAERLAKLRQDRDELRKRRAREGK